MKKGPRYIFLTQGKVAIVDFDDYDWLSQWRWGYSNGYARRIDYSQGASRRVYMHREILCAPEGSYTDHANRDRLDNRRVNIRLCTQSQNCVNRPTKKSVWGFKGVSRHVHWESRNLKKPFMARIQQKNPKVYLAAYFSTPEEAARQYDKWAKQIYGDFATLNFPGA